MISSYPGFVELLMTRFFRYVSLGGLFAFVLMAAAIPVSANDDLSEAQRKQINQMIQTYIMENPRVILEAVQRMQAQEEEDKQNQARQNLVSYRDQLINDPKAPISGNPDGDVTIVEFFDYRCGYCKRVSPTVEKVVKEDGNVRVVYKEFPILGPESVVAARASLAIWRLAPEKYMEFHSGLMNTRGGVSMSMIASVAKKIGLDSDMLVKEMKSAEIDADLQNNYELAQSLGISGTPAFVIGNELVPGAIDGDALKALIKEARGS